MKRLFAALLALIASVAHATQYYVTQSGAGSANGTSLGNAWSVSNYNASGTTTQPGDTVNISGTLTQEISVPNGGSSGGGNITIHFLSGANITATTFAGASFPSQNAAIYSQGKNYLTIDGGSNGIIQCTNNGSAPTYANQNNCAGVFLYGCTNCTVKNLTVANLYVMNINYDTTANPGKGVVAIWEGGTAPANITVTNCVFHDMFDGVEFAYGPSSANMVMSFCTCYNCNWGGNAQDDTIATTLSGLVVHDNHVYNWGNWDNYGLVSITSFPNGGSGYQVGDVLTVLTGTGGTITVTSLSGSAVNGASVTTQGTGYGPSVTTFATSGGHGTNCTVKCGNNIYHHNGFYAWAEATGTLTDPQFYNNIFGPGYGTGNTSGLYISCLNGTVTGLDVWNNLFVATNGGNNPGNGLLTIRSDGGSTGLMNGTINVYNNTFIGPNTVYTGASLGLYPGTQDVCTYNVYNNLFYGGGTSTTAFAVFNANTNATLNIDYNLANGYNTSDVYSFTTGESSVFKTFAQWQALSGNGLAFSPDPHGSNALPTFSGSTYIPASGSVVLAAGTNLSSTFTTDLYGYIRPATGAWTIGAMQNPPCGTMTATTLQLP